MVLRWAGDLSSPLPVTSASPQPRAPLVAAGVNVGLMANFWRLPRLVGLGPAREILLTGDDYDAHQALRWGLVTAVCEPRELMNLAMRKAQRIASRAPLSVE